MTSLALILFLLTLNAFFVAAEFALVKVRGFRIDKLAEGGSGPARMTARILGNLEAYLAACQLGITMASLGLGWVGEPAVAALLEPLFHSLGMPAEVLHTTSFLIGFLLFSSLHIVVGEQVPKSYAIRQSDTVALWCAYPLHCAYLLVWPLNWLLDRASRGILTLLKVEEATHADIYTDEELQGFVSTSKSHGSIEESKADMLHNIFDFDLRTVGRVMVPRHAVQVLDIAAAAADNLSIVTHSGHSRFPVIDSRENDRVLGVVLAKELYHALLKQTESSEVWSTLGNYTRTTLVVPEQQRISQLFEQMRSERNHLAVIVDEYGVFVGIVTLEDLLEEIVGEIDDETDAVTSDRAISELTERSWDVDALTSLSDLQRTIGMVVDSGLDANTLSGLLMAHLERMPIAGDTVVHNEFLLTVLTMQDRRAGIVRVEKQIIANPIEPTDVE